MNSKLINQFLDSMDIISDRKIEKLNNNTIIEATIITVIIPKFMYIKQNFYPTDLVPWKIQMAISRNKKYAELIDTLEAL